ncbi:hypothetical protein GCM10022381_40440 [Leifsonia kafniensis]|uniref:Uncharacterized protein n=1 Tax=Leifsonia kafniensis TaxID=475957 RepID=A0ABP7L7U2_9MICO
MKVIVSRSGGIAGIRLTWEVQVEDQPDSSDWLALISTLPWRDSPRTAPQPDRFVYRIRCNAHDVELAEPDLAGPWRELVERVQRAHRPPPTE